MTPPDWPSQDYSSAQTFLAENEEQAASETVLDAGDGLTVILPTGLPAYGMSLPALFMQAPLLVFMVILILFPVLGFVTRWDITPTTLAITAGCAIMFWGFTRVLRLMFANRDLFPRSCFVTLGRKGIAMHFSRLHFPFRSPRTSIPWKEKTTAQKTTFLFLPALLFGNPFADSIEVLSEKSGEKILIPFRLHEPQADAVKDAVEKLIRQNRK